MGVLHWSGEAGLASASDVRLVSHRPKGTSLHVFSTRRDADAGYDPLPSLARNRPLDTTMRPADSLNRYLLVLFADAR